MHRNGEGDELYWQLGQSKRRLWTKRNACVWKGPPSLSLKVTEQHWIATPAFNAGLFPYITVVNICGTLPMLRSGVEISVEYLNKHRGVVERFCLTFLNKYQM